MPRIAGVNIPNDKRTVIALTYIFGVGKTTAQEVLEKLDIDGDVRAKELTEKEIRSIANELEENYTIEGDLKRERLGNVKRLKEIDSYRGKRHEKDLPVRGQRTRTNSRTVRGNVRRTAGSGKTKLTKT
jgi:small subunit ribosomal protein S13